MTRSLVLGIAACAIMLSFSGQAKVYGQWGCYPAHYPHPCWCPPAPVYKCDCIVNRTGKTVRVTLISPRGPKIIFDRVAPNEVSQFYVPAKREKWVIVAYEYGTDNVVSVWCFITLPQACPASLCVPYEAVPCPPAKKQKRENRETSLAPVT